MSFIKGNVQCTATGLIRENYDTVTGLPRECYEIFTASLSGSETLGIPKLSVGGGDRGRHFLILFVCTKKKHLKAASDHPDTDL